MSKGEQGSLSVKDHHLRELPSGVTQGRGQCSEGGVQDGGSIEK